MAVQSIKHLVFISLVLVILAIVVLAVSNLSLVAANALWILLIVVFVLVAWKGDMILMLQDYERAVIMRFGRVVRVGGPGWCIVLPFIESPTIVELRVQTIDVPPQEVITKSKVEITIDSVIYLRVGSEREDAIKSVTAVENYRDAALHYVTSSLRDILGQMEFEEIISNIEAINKKLKEGLKEVSKAWGIVIDNVQIEDVDLPPVVQDAIHLEKASEQERLARMEKAKAHEFEIETVKRAAEQLSDKALSYYYVKALEKIGEGKGSTFFFPMEITRLAESIAAGTKRGTELEDLFKQYAPVVKSLVEKKGPRPRRAKRGAIKKNRRN